MRQQALLGGERFDDGAVRCKIPAQHREAPGLCERFLARADHIGVVDLRSGNVLTQRFPVHCAAVELQQGRNFVQKTAQPSRIVKIFHQEGAGRPQVRQHGNVACKLVEAVDIEVDTCASCHRDEMNDRVG